MRYTGENLVVQWIFSGGTATLDTNFRKVETDEKTDKADKAAGHDTHKSYSPTLLDTTINVSGLDVTRDDAAGSITWVGTEPQAEGTLVWSPAGTAVGKLKRTVEAMVEERKLTYPYDNLVEIEVDFQAQAQITDAYWS